ncbi:MAG: CocE/NonD family hydrolase [Planctomycetota bacterium]
MPAQESRQAATAKPAAQGGKAAASTSNVPAAVAKSPLRPEDVYRFDSPTQPALSPSGSQAAYIRQWIDPASLLERHSLWTASLANDGSRSVVAAEPGEPDARLPVYSPDGRWIAIRSTRSQPNGWKPTPAAPPESEPATDIWLLPTQGGPAVPLAGPDKPYGRVFTDPFYSRVAFSPDSQSLVFVADDGLEPRTLEEREADVTVVRPDQGEGYTGYGPAQIWVARLHSVPPGQTFSTPQAAAKIERLTQDEIWYGDPQWLPDGRSLVVHANRTADVESVRFSINKNFDLWSLDIASRRLTRLTFGPGPEVSPRVAPDGRSLVCLSSPRNGPHADIFQLLVVDLTSQPPQARVVHDHHMAGDTPPAADALTAGEGVPVFPLPDNAWDGPSHVVHSSNVGVSTATYRVALATGERQRLELVDPPTAYQQAFRRRSALVPPGNAFLAERLTGQTTVETWESEPGVKIEGVLTVPPPSVAKAPYKLLVHPHGGPHSRSATGFNFTAELFAAQGFAVFQPNFRGSQGYGRKFLDADRRDFGGGDMRDILTGIEHLAKRGIIDPKRQFVYGTSYGGYMTTWLVGQTRQFKAAVAQNPVTDLNVMWGCGDLQSWTEWEFGGRPWEVPDLMRKHSPSTYVDRVETPTLLLHAREDRRCPIAMSTLYHQSLVKRGVKTQMVVYPNEGHGIKQPRHRVDVFRRAFRWFAEAEDNVDLGGVVERHVMIPMRDGTRLSAYLYFPPGDGPWPVLYEQRYADLRAPSSRQNFAKLARGGYVVCAENFRGSQRSEGQWVGYRALGWGELQDGYDTVEWLAAQPWSTGKVGTFGSSQAGFAQNFLAVARPPHLAAQYMIDTGLSLFHEGYRIGGATRPERFKQMETVCRVPEHNRTLLDEWFSHPHYDAYWQAEDCSRHFDKMDVPCFTIGSWYDFMCIGSIDSYIGRQHRGGPGSRGRQQLLIGPWLHGRFKETNKAGQLEYPENAKFPMDDHMLRWFDHHLKGVNNGADKDNTVRYYVMGPLGEQRTIGNEWRTATDWPIAARATPYYLAAGGQLDVEAPATPEQTDSAASRTTFRADPLKPNEIPARGFPGAADARDFEKQSEVRSFTTPPLTEDVEWTGKVRAELLVSSTAPDTDFIVRVSDVYPDGRSILIIDYIRRARYRDGYEQERMLAPGQITPVSFDVGWLSQIFAKGHRIRVTIASTGAPFYEPNPNTGEPLTLEPPARTAVATNAVWHSQQHASRIIAPVVANAKAALPEKEAARPKAPVNVLFIMADDLRCELGCYGSRALTPRLDKLASRGIRYDRAYCQQAVCNPSRSSLLTGKRPDTLRLWNNGTHFRERNPDVATLPGVFLAAGYDTRCVGKIFHNWHTAVKGDRPSWSVDEFLHYANHGDDKTETVKSKDATVASLRNWAGIADWNYGQTRITECLDVPDEAYYDGRVAAEAVKTLEKYRAIADKASAGSAAGNATRTVPETQAVSNSESATSPTPFFLAVGFWKPHAPFNAPKKYWDLYDRAQLRLDAATPAARVPDNGVAIALHDSRELLGIPPATRIPNAEQSAEMRHGYFANISYLDAQIGKVLDALERCGFRDNTAIVFVGDHGFHIGEHTLWGKTSCFEHDARVPLIVCPPGGMPATSTRQLVELIDIFPTLASLCGVPAPVDLEGVSLLNRQSAGKTAAYTQHPRPAYYDRTPSKTPTAMGYSVRTATHRYTEWRAWSDGAILGFELYDHAADPSETMNIAGAASSTVALAAARSQLHAQFPTTVSPAKRAE